SRKEVYVEPPQTLSLPVGTYRQVEDHYSIQHDFPQTYHIGQEGLSKTASPERVMQARQLKGYLIFYDQILADYLAQLAHFPKLFSLDPAISRTYFSQFLKNIAGTTQSFETEFYTDLQEVLDLEGQWKLSEDDTSFHDRRNRVLDHLMARFAEQFTNYVLLMNSRRHNGRTGKPDNELIADKIQFLTEYPEISRERNKAFNYRPQSNSEIWDTDNVSGAQKRISRLTGIDSYERRNLDCPELLDVLFTTSKSGAQFLLKIKDSSSQQIFKSREKFPSREAAMAKAKIIFSVFQDEKTATIQQRPSDGKYVLFFKKGSTQLTHDRLFDSQVEASAIWHAVQERYRDLLTGRSPGGSEKILCNKEGFFLIEHILLRPFQEGDTLMDICLGPDCEGCGDEDPYSFRVSIVLPYWPTGFQDREFRRFFERTLREQIPAHILVK
ncbi:hypothetical protein GWO43_27650, partial [candidate division KSB1 bacterium]|nr:hypothetical protein [candidate division KSB1 bacterium]NIS23452.1 hypothetical protein [candidate division KSB1 bacterium]NIT74568.1 hypothetical protein [candidate division KSB1 bacterium]NIU27010.1 hypothetical protein [candidate division KSB1 bacterium]NIV95359.1 hypothetical protein [candidate division KSB1 bacterium]